MTLRVKPIKVISVTKKVNGHLVINYSKPEVKQ